MLVQALALLVVVGVTIPGYLDYRLHPISCRPDEWCMDFRSLPFIYSALFLGPPALLLLTTYWLWRRPRRWPAVFPLLVDAAIIGVALVDLIAFAQVGSAEPNIVLQVLMGLVPAVVSLTLILALLRQWDSRKPTADAVSPAP